MNIKKLVGIVKRVWSQSAHILLDGSVRFGYISFPKAVFVGVSAVILLYVSVAGIISVSVPWENKSDTQYHIDYVWSVYNGKLPTFNEGITYPPLKNSHNVHLTASHPPLFYVIQAPFLGPLLKSGQWEQAIAVGRAINIFIGVLCIVALAWAGWVYGGSNKALMAIAVPAIGALMYRFTTLNVIFGNDVLVVLFATISFVLIYKLLQEGMKTNHIIALGIVSALGMSTKATYVVILCVSLLAVVVAAILHKKSSPNRRIGYGLAISFLIALLIAIIIGWFYYRNYQASGSWFKSSPDDYSGGRVYKSLAFVLTSPTLWALFYTNSSSVPLFSTAVTSFAAAGFLTLKSINIKKYYKKNKPYLITVAVLALAVLGVLITQIKFAVGYGSINFRYLLPVLLPISMFLAYGLLRFKIARAQLVSIAAIGMGLMTALPVAASTTVSKLVPAVLSTHNDIAKIFIAASSNGVPDLVTSLLILFFVAGSILLVASLFRLTSTKNRLLTELRLL